MEKLFLSRFCSFSSKLTLPYACGSVTSSPPKHGEPCGKYGTDPFNKRRRLLSNLQPSGNQRAAFLQESRSRSHPRHKS